MKRGEREDREREDRERERDDRTYNRGRERKEREECLQTEVPNMAVDISGTEVSSHNIHYILLNLVLGLLSIINEPLHNQARFTHT